MEHFLPTSIKEMKALGWEQADIILFTGDAYIDHPAFGTAVIARVLEAAGYKVAVIPQPNWRDDLRDFRKLGEPRLFFGVNSGAMDSMINHYTAAKRLRSNDAYTPEDRAGARPDYAVSVYTGILKKLYPHIPVIIGGIEASLRRFTHYDYWKDCLMGPVLATSGADYLSYGMGERSMIAMASYLDSHLQKMGLDSFSGFAASKTSFNELADNFPEEELPQQIGWISSKAPEPGTIVLNSLKQCQESKKAFVESFNTIELQANKMHAQLMVEPLACGRYFYLNPPYLPMSQEELDAVYSLPFTRLPHPRYKDKFISAYEMIKDSVTTHRGCFGGCSFCTIAAHQGKFIQSRSHENIVAEIEKIAARADFKGNLSDVGAPTANMYGMGGKDSSICEKCIRKSCLSPNMCANLNHSHWNLLSLYSKIAKVKGIKHAYIGSGIRYDLFIGPQGFLGSGSKEYMTELVKEHTCGRLKVAPEHTQSNVLALMNKPSFKLFEVFHNEFDRIVSQASLHCKLVPYFISSHPGCTLKDMESLSRNASLKGVYMEQVQDFTPTPMTRSSVMFYTGVDLKTLAPIYVERNIDRKKKQKSLFFK